MEKMKRIAALCASKGEAIKVPKRFTRGGTPQKTNAEEGYFALCLGSGAGRFLKQAPFVMPLAANQPRLISIA